MKILVILSRFPYPLEKGDKLRAFNQIIRLSKKHEILLFAVSDRILNEEVYLQLSPYCEKIEIFYLSKFGILFNLMKVFFTSLPFQISYFYRKNVQKRIDRIMEENKPDFIFCQLIRMAKYTLKYKNIPKVLDYMDVFSIGLKRRMDLAPFYSKWLFKMEYYRTLKYEAHLLHSFNSTCIISSQDRDMIYHSDKDKINVISNGVDFDYFKTEPTEKKYDILFTGNMAYPPNVEAVLFLVKKIIPLVEKKINKIKICIAGTTPVKSILALRSNHVEITGWVKDIREYYKKSKIFIAPMQIGTGLQNKLLEAMAMRLPCITSPLANNALNAIDGESILIAETIEDYAEAITELYFNPDKARAIADMGYEFVHQNYNWDNNVEKLEKLFLC